jgi:hypothetical protein
VPCLYAAFDAQARLRRPTVLFLDFVAGARLFAARPDGFAAFLATAFFGRAKRRPVLRKLRTIASSSSRVLKSVIGSPLPIIPLGNLIRHWAAQIEYPSVR